jgi:hypothetical protein
MPYLDNYTSILDGEGINYDLAIWDRIGREEKADFVFFDKTNSYRKSFFSYLKYSYFIRKILNKHNYDIIIVFGLQLTFFLKNILLRRDKYKYVIDIRDYNKILKVTNLKHVLRHAHFVVISSPKYRSWLPTGISYILNHNMSLESFEQSEMRGILDKSYFTISYIGTLVNLEINISLIEEFKNSDLFKLRFVGAGLINEDLKKYIERMDVKNVEIMGKYEKCEEGMYYRSSDFISMILETNYINSTVLSNRLYNAALYAVPLIALEGSLISSIINEYNLGLVVNDINGLSTKLLEYIEGFDEDIFLEGRSRFLKRVVEDNKLFRKKLIEFISSCQDSENDALSTKMCGDTIIK